MEINSSIKHIARRAGSSTDVMEEVSALIKTHDLLRQEHNYARPMQQYNLGRSHLQNNAALQTGWVEQNNIHMNS